MSNQELEFREKAKKNQQIIERAFFIFLLVAALIMYFDLGKIELFGIFSEVISAIVPSVSKTAVLTPAPKSSALVLSLAWALVPITLFWMFRTGDLKRLPVEITAFTVKKLFLIFIGMIILFGMFFYGVTEPNDSIKFGMMIYTQLTENRYFIAIYGTILWLVVTVLIWGLTIFLGLTHLFLKRD